MISIGQAEYLGASLSKDEGYEPDDILDYVVSTAVDIGATTWNSLVPEATGWEVDTGEILHGLNEDMGQFYDSNRELVHASSFIGGMFVPMLAASKAMKAATTATGWVGKATPLRYLAGKETSYTSAAKTALEAGGAASAEYRNARKMLKATNLAQGLTEGVMFESSLVMLMNDHAYMENNYSIGDYAFGVGLGAIAGPLRVWQGTKAFKAIESSIELTQQTKMVRPEDLLTMTPSQALHAKSYQAASTKAVDLNGLSDTNKLAQEALQDKATTDVFDQVAKMSTADMVKEGDELAKGFSLTSTKSLLTPEVARTAFEEPSIGLVAKMELAKPGTFSGAQKFAPHNAAATTSTMVDMLVRETKVGTAFESGAVARNLIAPSTKTKADLDLAKIPDVLTISKADEGINISIRGKLEPETKEWLAGYLVSAEAKALPVSFDRSFKISKKALAEEAAAKELELFGTGFISYDKALDLVQESGRMAIIDPFFPNRLLGELEAKTAAGAASIPELGINTALKAKDPIPYNPFIDSSPVADKAFIESLYMAKAEKAVDGVFKIPESGIQALAKVQAIHSANAGKTFKIAMGDKTLGDAEAVASWMWDTKVAGVWAGLAADASTAQIARHLNMPLDTVDTIIAWGKKPMPRNAELPMSVYTDVRLLDGYAKPGVAAIGDAIAKGKLEEIEVTKMLDLDTMKGMHDEVVANTITDSLVHGGVPEELGGLLDDVYQSAPMGAIRDGINTILSDIASKSKLIVSSDMALRTLGPLADMVTTMGRTAQHYTNQNIVRVSKAIEPSLLAVEQDIASAFQFAQLDQAIQALDGKLARGIRYNPEAKMFQWKKGDEVTNLKVLGSETDLVLTDKMDSFIRAYLPIMNEQHGFTNVMRKMTGQAPAKANGIWFPYETMDKKLIAYKMPRDGGDPTMIVAHTEAKLKELVTAAQAKFGETHRIITRDTDAVYFNNIHYQAELNPIRRADAEMKKAGIAISDINPTGEAIKRFRQSLKDDIWTKHRRMFRLANSDVFSVLTDAARQETKFAKSGTGSLLQKMQKPLSTAEVVQRTLLNQGFSDYAPIMDMGNNIVSATINTVLHKGDQLTTTLRNELGKGAEADWVKFRQALINADIPIPYKDAHEYAMARRGGEALDTAEQRIAQVQSLDVLFRLRFGELAHAGVTVLSTPVILAGELAHNRMPMKTMTQAIKFMYGGSAEGARVMAKAKELGYVQGVVAESKEAIQNLHTTDIISTNSRIMGWLTKASDVSEDFVREWAFATGYLTAKAKHPEALEGILIAHAQGHTQRTMGNYVAKQRPVMFQGALGSMLGLYQTFMVTMGQNMFRYLEAADYKAVSTLMAGQAGMFGLESLPLFQDFNRVMGAYMSDDHMDIRSTTYAAANGNPKLAEYILYGLPSATFGNSLYTRAAWQPRTPFDETGAEAGLSVKPVIWSSLVETLDFAGNVIGGVADTVGNGGGIIDAKKAVMQAAAAQTIWRPLSRIAELEMRVSYDKKGEVLSTAEEVATFPSYAARVLGTRPLKETVLRNARYTTSYYNSIDRDSKARAIKQLRRAVTDEPDSDMIAEIMTDYLDAGGTYKGWQGIYNKSVVSTATPFANRLLEFSAKQPGMHSLINEYAN